MTKDKRSDMLDNERAAVEALRNIVLESGTDEMIVKQARAICDRELAESAPIGEACPVCAEGILVEQRSCYCSVCGTSSASGEQLKSNTAARRATSGTPTAPSAKLASFPLEDGAYESAPDSKVLWGFGDWLLTVGDVRSARATAGSAAPDLPHAGTIYGEIFDGCGAGKYERLVSMQDVGAVLQVIRTLAGNVATAVPGELTDDRILEIDDEIMAKGVSSKGYCIDYARAIEREVLASNAGAVPADAEQLVPAGWQFNTADFSCVASGRHKKGNVTLVRDAAGRAEFNKLCQNDDFDADAFQLYIYGSGATLREAIAAAVRAAPSNNLPVGAQGGSNG